MALIHQEEYPIPQEPEKSNLGMPGSGAPTQETAEQYDVPLADTRLQSTTVSEGIQPPEIESFPPVTTPNHSSRRGLAIGAGVAAVALSAAAFFGLTGGGEKEQATQEVSAEAPLDASISNNSSPTSIEANDTRTAAENRSEVEQPGNYELISPQEAALLEKLSAYNYPNHIRGGYVAKEGTEKAMFAAVATDLMATINTHDFDGSARLFGYEHFEDLSDSASDRATIEGLDAFYAPDMNNIRTTACQPEGDDLSCRGYMSAFLFDRTMDPNSPRTLEYINDPVFEGQPTTAGQVYFEITYRMNKADGILEDLQWFIHFDEPRL